MKLSAIIPPLPAAATIPMENGPHMPLADIIKHTGRRTVVAELFTAKARESILQRPRNPTGSRDPERKQPLACALIPETKSATMTSNNSDTDSGDVVGYKPVCINSADSGTKKLDSNWNVAVKIDHFDILRVKGGIDTNAASEGANNLDRYAL